MSDLSVLTNGGVVLIASDTLPGLHALATHPDAAEALRVRKASPPGRPFLLLFADLDAVLEFGRPGAATYIDDLRRAWPGPLTALLRPKPKVPREWIHEGHSFAARVPEREELRALLRELGAPLFSTSANEAGEEPARSLREAALRFPELPVLLGENPDASGEASTLVDLTGRTAELLRPGAAPWPPDRS